MAAAASNDEEKPFLWRATDYLRPAFSKNSVLPNFRAISKDLGLPSSKISDVKGKDAAAHTPPVTHLTLASRGGTAGEDDNDGRRYARTVPAWVKPHEQDDDDDNDADANSFLLPQFPAASRTPHHLFIPTSKPGQDPGRGKRMDAGRSREPVTIRAPVSVSAPRWQSFGRNGHPPRIPDVAGEIVDDDWEQERLADLEKPWRPERVSLDEKKPEGLWILINSRRSATGKQFHYLLMNNPFVVLIIRLIVLVFVLAALGVGASIYHRTDALNSSAGARAGTLIDPSTEQNYICEQQPSTYMAFMVDSCAVVYLGYITWDEYRSKPLGLRKTRDKLRLLFLDIVFIIFSSAALALSFNTLTDRQWACYSGGPATNGSSSNNQMVAQSTCVHNGDLCRRQKALCGVLLIALFVWLQTFAISVLRQELLLDLFEDIT